MSKKKYEVEITYNKTHYVLMYVETHAGQNRGLLYVPTDRIKVTGLYAHNRIVYPECELLEVRVTGGTVVSPDKHVYPTLDQIDLMCKTMPNAKLTRFLKRASACRGLSDNLLRYRLDTLTTEGFPKYYDLDTPYWNNLILERMSADLNTYAMHVTNATAKLKDWLDVQYVFMKSRGFLK